MKTKHSVSSNLLERNENFTEHHLRLSAESSAHHIDRLGRRNHNVESTSLTVISFILGLLFAMAVTSYANNLLQSDISLADACTPLWIGTAIVVVLLMANIRISMPTDIRTMTKRLSPEFPFPFIGEKYNSFMGMSITFFHSSILYGQKNSFI